MTDPAEITWIEASNLFRNSVEFLTYVDSDNVTYPYLAESWHASEDLKTWDFKLREGVRWSNGDPFTVADVAFNLNRWISPRSKSPNRTTFGAINVQGGDTAGLARSDAQLAQALARAVSLGARRL